MSDQMIELFVQGEGIADITLIRVPRDTTARDVVQKAMAEGGISAPQEEILLFVEDQDNEQSQCEAN